ncbi:N-Acetyl-D-glucosamine ABC transport system [Rothia aeria]|uniref:N-Acetyl-D-glucosamine ABC transport system n=1 Tax=Rothia aeria TaxID=172042 RepID=A0A2Z5QZK4_9MICC|nr:N-Acetyl-D-glucosamine ABC transport system [Rothia aeria]
MNQSFGNSGSSPRMRGTPEGEGQEDDVEGLIPTYAGNTESATTRTLPVRAHPHVCGEHGFR